MLSKDLFRLKHVSGIKFKTAPNTFEDVTSSRMDDPAVDVGDREPARREPVLEPGRQMTTDQSRDTRGQGHAKPVLTDLPAHAAGGFRKDPTQRAGDSRAIGAGPEQRTSRTIGEDGVGDLLIPAWIIDLIVKTAHLDAHQHHHRSGIRSNECRSDGKAIEARVASHESDVGSRDVRRQAEPFDETVVDARGSRTGARHGDEMSDLRR